MSWICPECGFDNKQNPLNSRHRPNCCGCKKEMQTPEEMQKEIDEEIKNYVEEIKEERKRLDRASEWISGLESDLSEAQLDFEDAAKIIKKSKQELERLNNIHVFREADKETKAIRDIQQKKIMVVVGCQT